MTSLEKALEKYIDERRLAHQREISESLYEMIREAKQRTYAQEIADGEDRSRRFLDKLLRGR